MESSLVSRDPKRSRFETHLSKGSLMSPSSPITSPSRPTFNHLVIPTPACRRAICPPPCDRKRVEAGGLKETNEKAGPEADTLYTAAPPPRRPAAPPRLALKSYLTAPVWSSPPLPPSPSPALNLPRPAAFRSAPPRPAPPARSRCPTSSQGV